MIVNDGKALLNRDAAVSLAEDLADTLTPHRLGVYAVSGCSFKTRTCLASVNSLIAEVKGFDINPMSSHGPVTRIYLHACL